MSLKFALLGFLNYEPMTGYELKQHFDNSIYYFWNARLSQIYPTLTKMKEENLLTMELVHQDDRPNRKIYHITEDGREELYLWLRELVEMSPIRVAFLIKIFFGGRLKKEEMLDLLRHQMGLHQERLVVYQERVRKVLQENIEASGMEREGVFWNLTVEMGIKYEEGWIEWCQEAISKVEAMTN